MKSKEERNYEEGTKKNIIWRGNIKTIKYTCTYFRILPIFPRYCPQSYDSLNKKLDKLIDEVEDLKNIMKETKIQKDEEPKGGMKMKMITTLKLEMDKKVIIKKGMVQKRRMMKQKVEDIVTMFKNQNVMETILNLQWIRLVEQNNKICINSILITYKLIIVNSKSSNCMPGWRGLPHYNPQKSW